MCSVIPKMSRNMSLFRTPNIRTGKTHQCPSRRITAILTHLTVSTLGSPPWEQSTFTFAAFDEEGWITTDIAESYSLRIRSPCFLRICSICIQPYVVVGASAAAAEETVCVTVEVAILLATFVFTARRGVEVLRCRGLGALTRMGGVKYTFHFCCLVDKGMCLKKGECHPCAYITCDLDWRIATLQKQGFLSDEWGER